MRQMAFSDVPATMDMTDVFGAVASPEGKSDAFLRKAKAFAEARSRPRAGGLSPLGVAYASCAARTIWIPSSCITRRC